MSTVTATRGRLRVPWQLVVGVLVAALVVVTSSTGTGARAADGPVESVYVARGHDFPDALVGGVLAAMEAAPILTVLGPEDGDAIPPATIEELARLRPREIVILGGPVAVSEAVEAQLGAFTEPAGNTRRLAGDDRFGTAVEISRALPDRIGDVAHAATADDAHRLGGQAPDAFWQKSEPVDAATLGGTALADLAPHTFEFTIAADDWGSNLHYGSNNIYRGYDVTPDLVGGHDLGSFFREGGSILAYADATHEGGGSLGGWHTLPYAYSRQSMSDVGIRIDLLVGRGRLVLSRTTNGWDNQSILSGDIPDEVDVRLVLVGNVH